MRRKVKKAIHLAMSRKQILFGETRLPNSLVETLGQDWFAAELSAESSKPVHPIIFWYRKAIGVTAAVRWCR
jgi:hypothetical protein